MAGIFLLELSDSNVDLVRSYNRLMEKSSVDLSVASVFKRSTNV